MSAPLVTARSSRESHEPPPRSCKRLARARHERGPAPMQHTVQEPHPQQRERYQPHAHTRALSSSRRPSVTSIPHQYILHPHNSLMPRHAPSTHPPYNRLHRAPCIFDRASLHSHYRVNRQHPLHTLTSTQAKPCQRPGREATRLRVHGLGHEAPFSQQRPSPLSRHTPPQPPCCCAPFPFLEPHPHPLPAATSTASTPQHVTSYPPYFRNRWLNCCSWLTASIMVRLMSSSTVPMTVAPT